jgi:hypothetical protein
MKTILVIAIFGLSFIEFNKHTNDYRDLVCGTYSCIRIHEYPNQNLTTTIKDTSIVTLIISKSETDSLLIINTLEGFYSFKLKDFKINSVNPRIRFYGKFSNDSIYLNFMPSNGPFSYKYLGRK